MSDQGHWFKLWCSSLDDPDLDNLPLEQWARWAKLGAYIKKHGDGGKLSVSAPSSAMCSFLKCVTFDAAIECISMLPNVTVTRVTNASVTHEIEWKNWQRFQGDNSLHRVQKFREKKRESVTAKKRREEKRRDIPPNPPPGKPEKVAFAPRVHMTSDEHAALVAKHGTSAVAWMVEKLDSYKTAKGREYKSDAAAIRQWVVEAWEKHRAENPNPPGGYNGPRN